MPFRFFSLIWILCFSWKWVRDNCIRNRDIVVEYVLHTIMHAGVARCNQNRTFLKALWNRHKTHDLFSSAMLTGYIWRFKQRYVISVNYAMSRVKYTNYSLISPSQVKGLTSLTSPTSTISTTFGLLSTRICLENKNKILVVPSHWLKELAGSLNSKILFCDWLESSRSNQFFVIVVTVVTFHFILKLREAALPTIWNRS